MKYLIGIDIGTSGAKAVAFDESGNAIASATAEYPLYQPQNGWAEQSPEDWWEGTVKALKRITSAVDASKIAAVGLSGQMHGLVMLDSENSVIRPSIIWCDQRTSRECEDIEALVGRDRLMDITASHALPGFTASKLMWVKKHEPENYARCRHMLLPKDFIRFRLTGEYATDVSDASGMQLMDIKNRCWSDEILSHLGIDRAYLAQLHESCEVSGYITKEAARLTGLPEGIPVAAGAGDNAASAIGTGVIESGKAFVTIGTSGVLFAHTDEPTVDTHGRVHTFCSAVPDKWHLMGVTQAAGLSLKWFRDNFCPDISYGELDALAKKVPVGANKLIYLPYLMGERTPHLDSYARGVFFGLSSVHKVPEMARAVMEGVTYSLCDCLDIFREMSISLDSITACGGGSKSTLWQQMIADSFACKVKTLRGNEGGALGAAILGGVACGIYGNVADGCARCVHEDSDVLPQSEYFEQYARYYSIYRDVYHNLKDTFKTLNNI